MTSQLHWIQFASRERVLKSLHLSHVIYERFDPDIDPDVPICDDKQTLQIQLHNQIIKFLHFRHKETNNGPSFREQLEPRPEGHRRLVGLEPAGPEVREGRPVRGDEESQEALEKEY